LHASPGAFARPPTALTAPMPDDAADHTLTGEFRTHESFHSKYLEHDRTIIVSLPQGYDPEGARRYPVLYLHDGQNLFDRATSVGEEWGVDETVHWRRRARSAS
jgi:predicted alpha/beta superfamily hydrolase